MAKTIRRQTHAERREKAETRFLDYAVKLVAERGYDGFTLADVADAAGYSRGLPAHYFGRKEDLLARVAEVTIESYHRRLAELSESERGLPRIEELVRIYVSTRGVALRCLQILLAQALVQPKLRKTVERLNAEGLEAIRKEIGRGIERGNIRSDVNVEHQAALIYAFLRGQMAFATLDSGWEEVAIGDEFIATLRDRRNPRQ